MEIADERGNGFVEFEIFLQICTEEFRLLGLFQSFAIDCELDVCCVGSGVEHRDTGLPRIRNEIVSVEV